MKSILYVLLVLSALAYYPLFPSEEFETSKVYILMSFACFGFFYVSWKQIFQDRIAWYLLIFIGSIGLSTIYSIDRNISIFGNPKFPNGFLIWVSYLIFYLAACQYLTTYIDKLRASRIVIITSFVVSCYAIVQVLGYDFKQWFGTLNEHGYMRPMSTLGHPNFMAAYLSMTLPFCLERFDLSELKIERIFSAIVGIVSLITIFFSQSRGMWWATLGAIFCYQYLSKRSFKKIYAMVIVLFIITGIATSTSKTFREEFGYRLKAIGNLGVARIEYLKGAIRIWKRYPLLGAGSDNFELAFQHQRTQQYWIVERGGSPHRAHNEFLNILATQGIVGAVSVIFLTISVFSLLYYSQAPMVSASIVAFYIQELSSFHCVATMVLLMLCLSFIRMKKLYS